MRKYDSQFVNQFKFNRYWKKKKKYDSNKIKETGKLEFRKKNNCGDTPLGFELTKKLQLLSDPFMRTKFRQKLRESIT